MNSSNSTSGPARTGLTDAEHTRNDGYQESQFPPNGRNLNQAGQVIGYSNRYDGSTSMGRTGWVYDPALGTVPLLLSVRSDGYAWSEPTFLGEDGVVLGTYQMWEGMVGRRPFYWTADDGMWDLGMLIDGGLSDNDWEALYDTIQNNGVGQIVGHGLLADMPSGQMPLLLTPLSMMLPGDANGDGVVNTADLSILAGNWQQAGFWARGDFNGDGVVNVSDLSILAANWQSGISGGTHVSDVGFVEAMKLFDAFDGVVVPEAGVVGVVGVLVGLGVMGMRRRPRRDDVGFVRGVGVC